jgi:hypothetical protein
MSAYFDGANNARVEGMRGCGLVRDGQKCTYDTLGYAVVQRSTRSQQCVEPIPLIASAAKPPSIGLEPML